MTANDAVLSVQPAFERVLDALERERCAWVAGNVGTGRATLARELVDHFDAEGGATWIDLLDLDQADAVIGGLFGAAGELTRDARARCMVDWDSLAAGARALAEAAGDRFVVVLTVPATWATARGPAATALDQAIRGRAQGLLRGLVTSDLRVVLITTRSAQPDTWGVSDERPIPLHAPKNALALLRSQDWGAYAASAEALARATKEDIAPSPVSVRLAVGAVGLGARAETMAEALEQPNARALHLLTDEIVDRLRSPGREPVRQAVERQVLARRPIEREALEVLAAVPDEHLPLLTDCVGYGEDEVRISANTRHVLLSKLLPTRREGHDVDLLEHHRALADHYARLDGKPDIVDTEGASTTAWLERMHHLAFVDPSASEHLPCRELYWERGRELSKNRRDYRAAAEIYRACVGRFPHDDYAWHYLGFNLERAGMERSTAQQAYERAVELAPDNPWWNSRLVTFLIGQGKLRSARQTWRDAVNRVDPDGDRSAESQWLGEHFYRWVSRAWLEAGSAADAFEVLQGLDEDLRRTPILRALEERVLDAVESEALGGSVYPARVPMAERWRAPRELPATHGEGQLRQWFPGRVVEATARGVTIVYGARDDGEYLAKMTFIDAADWGEVGRGRPEEAAGFVYLGVYQPGGAQRVVARAWDEQRFTSEPPTRDLPLAYFDRWRSQP
ncbi:MAG: tetratricopeptide repeat protein [Polyangiaceae bacterium]